MYLMCSDTDPNVVLPILEFKYITPTGAFDDTRETQITYRFDHEDPVSSFWDTGVGSELAYHSWHLEDGDTAHLWPGNDDERLHSGRESQLQVP